MQDLNERLAALAEGAPRRLEVGDLWDRGMRFHRRRRIGTAIGMAAILLVVCALGGLALGSSRARPGPSAPAGGAGRLPDRFYAPSPWLPGTDATGPLGRVVAVIPATHKSLLGSQQGYVGVSATTGEYRFLDLPDLASSTGAFNDSSVALSPDGRYFAYWTDAAADRSRVTGLAVADLETSRILRTTYPSRLGLMGHQLAWLSDDRLLFAWDRITSQGHGTTSGVLAGVRLWHVGVAAPEPVPHDKVDLNGQFSPSASGTVLVATGDRTLQRIRADRLARPVRVRVSVTLPFGAAPSPDGTLLAGLRGDATVRTDVPAPLAVAGTKAGLNEARTVPSVRAGAVVGWRDDAHVVVLQQSQGTGPELGSVLLSVDVRTGAGRELSSIDPQMNTPLLAADLLRGPVYAAPEPPHPLDPRLMGFLALLVAGGGALLLTRWRRRVRP